MSSRQCLELRCHKACSATAPTDTREGTAAPPCRPLHSPAKEPDRASAALDRAAPTTELHRHTHLAVHNTHPTHHGVRVRTAVRPRHHHPGAHRPALLRPRPGRCAPRQPRRPANGRPAGTPGGGWELRGTDVLGCRPPQPNHRRSKVRAGAPPCPAPDSLRRPRTFATATPPGTRRPPRAPPPRRRRLLWRDAVHPSTGCI